MDKQIQKLEPGQLYEVTSPGERDEQVICFPFTWVTFVGKKEIKTNILFGIDNLDIFEIHDENPENLVFKKIKLKVDPNTVVNGDRYTFEQTKAKRLYVANFDSTSTKNLVFFIDLYDYYNKDRIKGRLVLALTEDKVAYLHPDEVEEMTLEDILEIDLICETLE